MYGRIVQLPLFTGISGTDLLELQDRFPFSIEPIDAGTKLLVAGERTKGLLWIVSGTVRRNLPWMEESLEGPLLIEPERLFGLDNTTAAGWKAETALEILYISKENVVRHLLRNAIVRLNFMTLLSSALQRKSAPLEVPRTVEEKLWSFVSSARLKPDSQVTLHMKMTELAERLDVSRLVLSRTLNRLALEGKIELKRETIIING